MAIKDKDPNDKDHYANKRVRLAGDLIEDLFRVSLQQLARDLKYQLERHTTGRENSESPHASGQTF